MAKRKRKRNKINTGKPYEEFVGDIYDLLLKDDRFTIVERDVYMDGPDGKRQFDLLLRAQTEAGEILTVLECRDYNKRLDITHVDGLHSKMGDFGVNGVRVSRKGFSSKARSKAGRVGITLCLAATAGDVCNFIDVRIPISVKLVRSTINMSTKIATTVPNQSVESPHVINGVNLFESLASELLDGTIEIPDTTSEFEWFPIALSPPYTVWSSEGDIELANIKSRAVVVTEYYFGYLDRVPELTTHHDLRTSETTIIYTADQGQGIVGKLLQVASADAIPTFENGFRIRFVEQPKTKAVE